MSHICTPFDFRSASIWDRSNRQRLPIRVHGIDPSLTRFSNVGKEIFRSAAVWILSSVCVGRWSSVKEIRASIYALKSPVIACPIDCKGSALFAACRGVFIAPFCMCYCPAGFCLMKIILAPYYYYTLFCSY